MLFTFCNFKHMQSFVLKLMFNFLLLTELKQYQQTKINNWNQFSIISMSGKLVGFYGILFHKDTQSLPKQKEFYTKINIMLINFHRRQSISDWCCSCESIKSLPWNWTAQTIISFIRREKSDVSQRKWHYLLLTFKDWLDTD